MMMRRKTELYNYIPVMVADEGENNENIYCR